MELSKLEKGTQSDQLLECLVNELNRNQPKRRKS